MADHCPSRRSASQSNGSRAIREVRAWCSSSMSASSRAIGSDSLPILSLLRIRAARTTLNGRVAAASQHVGQAAPTPSYHGPGARCGARYNISESRSPTGGRESASMLDDLIEGLNEPQRQAVVAGGGPLLIIA